MGLIIYRAAGACGVSRKLRPQTLDLENSDPQFWKIQTKKTQTSFKLEISEEKKVGNWNTFSLR